MDGALHAPFSQADVDAIGAWVDGRLDPSEPANWAFSPGAVRAILAERWGWEAVRGPGPLTWEEAKLSMQISLEERMGFVMRKTAEIARGEEDAMAAQVASAVRGNR